MTRGEDTRSTILEHAYARARSEGLDALTIGTLATELHLSKSGVFAHFGSKEALQLAVLQHARDQFVADVVHPALRAPRGVPRLRALFTGWLRWGIENVTTGGCLFVAAAVQLDDREGPVREALVTTQKDWMDSLAHATEVAMREGQLRADTDPRQVAFELYGILLSSHHSRRLLRDAGAEARAVASFEGLITRYRAA